MKKLQNNFTTQEQSYKLLELDVPADSADCAYRGTNMPIDVLSPNTLYSEHKKDVHDLETKKDIRNGFFQTCEPCWSVGRLMEICKICEPKKYYEQLCEELQCSQNYCVVIISHIIANLPIIDFSKLDD